jgi:hypothetical protein
MGAAYMFVSAFYVAMSVLQGQSRNNIVAVAFVVGAWLITVPLCYPLSRTADMVRLFVAVARQSFFCSAHH